MQFSAELKKGQTEHETGSRTKRKRATTTAWSEATVPSPEPSPSSTVDENKVKASFKNGVLTVTLPQQEVAQGKKIAIES